MKIIVVAIVGFLLCGTLSSCASSCAVPKQRSASQMYSTPATKIGMVDDLKQGS